MLTRHRKSDLVCPCETSDYLCPCDWPPTALLDSYSPRNLISPDPQLLPVPQWPEYRGPCSSGIYLEYLNHYLQVGNFSLLTHNTVVSFYSVSCLLGLHIEYMLNRTFFAINPYCSFFFFYSVSCSSVINTDCLKYYSHYFSLSTSTNVACSL